MKNNISTTTVRVIMLLSLLQHKKYSSLELSQLLNCSKRHITRLVKGIRDAGIIVKSKPGKGGGYEIKNIDYKISGKLYNEMLRRLDGEKTTIRN